jgi:N-acetylmuramoyl-L-alanine amidase
MFNVLKGKRVKIALVATLFVAAFITLIITVAASSSPLIFLADTADVKTVIIDPGHGGMDGGAIGYDGVIEKGINLSISLKLRSFLLSSGYKVIMTREDDRSIHDKNSSTISQKKTSDLHNRLKIVTAHPDALLVSIHQNIFEDSKYSGTQVFYSKSNKDSKVLAQTLQSNIKQILQPDNNREIKEAQNNLYILYNARSPAVMVECGFLSNQIECKQLQDDNYQNKMAFSIFYGILQYMSK